MSFHLVLFKLRIYGLTRFNLLTMLRLLRFLPSLPFRPFEVLGESVFFLCYAPLFSFPMIFQHLMPFSALHLQFYPLLLHLQCFIFSGFLLSLPFRPFWGSGRISFLPLLCTIFQLSDVVICLALSIVSASYCYEVSTSQIVFTPDRFTLRVLDQQNFVQL